MAIILRIRMLVNMYSGPVFTKGLRCVLVRSFCMLFCIVLCAVGMSACNKYVFSSVGRGELTPVHMIVC